MNGGSSKGGYAGKDYNDDEDAGIITASRPDGRTSASASTSKKGRSSHSSFSGSRGPRLEVPTGRDDRFRGQKVVLNGQRQDIKPTYADLIQDLRRNRKDPEKVFTPRQASIWSRTEKPEKRPYPTHTFIEVYFPVKTAQFKDHDPVECGHICEGKPHGNFPLCRFCHKPIREAPTVSRLFCPSYACAVANDVCRKRDSIS